MAKGGMPLSAWRQTTGEAHMAPRYIHRAAFWMVFSWCRVEFAAEPYMQHAQPSLT